MADLQAGSVRWWRRTDRLLIVGLLFVTAAVVGTALWLDALGTRERRGMPVPDLRASNRIVDGGRVYAAHCASCHGVNLEGQPDWMTRRPDGRLPAPPHDDSGHTWHHVNDVLFAITRNGLKPPYAPPDYASDMPAFAGVISDDEIWNVLAYIQSRWSDKVRAGHDELERQDKARRRGN